jgi:hypothetical protein
MHTDGLEYICLFYVRKYNEGGVKVYVTTRENYLQRSTTTKARMEIL